MAGIFWNIKSPAIDEPGGGDWWQYNDTFTGDDGDPVNSTKWNDSGSSPVLIQDNTAEIHANDDLGWGYIISNFFISGDFDVQINFELQSPIYNQSSWNHLFTFHVDSAHYASGNLNYAGGGQVYTWIGSQKWSATAGDSNYLGALGTAGAWRIIRLGSIMTVWAWWEGGGGWQSVLSHSNSTADGRIYMRAWSGSTPDQVIRWNNFWASSATNIYYP
ncbi:MAG: hypothetical protein DRI98_08050 [Bacteroidetes bacterium]|nr:MAG: hypothetical protein DRI98_08050 [Bacteroidota bacterium]